MTKILNYFLKKHYIKSSKSTVVEFWCLKLYAYSPFITHLVYTFPINPVLQISKHTPKTPYTANLISNLFIYLFIYLVFLGPHLQHMEVPRLGVRMELWPMAYTIATATPVTCTTAYSNTGFLALKAKDQTFVLVDTSQIHFH